jgi:hypothetical protein
MSTHAVGYDKQVPPFLPRFRVWRKLNDARILIVLSSESDVSQCCVANLLFPEHAIFSSADAADSCLNQLVHHDAYFRLRHCCLQRETNFRGVPQRPRGEDNIPPARSL